MLYCISKKQMKNNFCCGTITSSKISVGVIYWSGKFMKENIKAEIDNLLLETTRFDFPFLASVEKKKEMILEKKLYIEKKVEVLAPLLFPDNERKEKIWEESVEYAENQFKSLPQNKRLNGFYFQELMHYYTVQLGDSIMNND